MDHESPVESAPDASLADLPAEIVCYIFRYLAPTSSEVATRPGPGLRASGPLSDLFRVIQTCQRHFEIGLPLIYAFSPALSPPRMAALLAALRTRRKHAYLDAVRAATIEIHGRRRTMGSQEYEHRVIMELQADKRVRREWLAVFGPNLRMLSIEYIPVTYDVDEELSAEHPETMFEVLERLARCCPRIGRLEVVGEGLNSALGTDVLVYFAAEIPFRLRMETSVSDLEGRLDQLGIEDRWSRLTALHIGVAELCSDDAVMFPASYRAHGLRSLSLGLCQPDLETHSALAKLYGCHIVDLSIAYGSMPLRESNPSSPWFQNFERLRSLKLSGVILSPAFVADIAPLFLRTNDIRLIVDGNPPIRFGNSITIRDVDGVVAAVATRASLAVSLKSTGNRTKLTIEIKEVDWFSMREIEALWSSAFGKLPLSSSSEAPGTRIELEVSIVEKTAPSRATALMIERETGFIPRDRGESGRAVRFRAGFLP